MVELYFSRLKKPCNTFLYTILPYAVWMYKWIKKLVCYLTLTDDS